MPIKTLNNLRMFWKEALAAIVKRLNWMPPIEKLRASWAEPVNSYAETPDIFKSFFQPYLAGGRPFPYAVLTPSFEGFIYSTTEKLVCDLDHEICVLERSGNTYLPHRYPLDGIIHVEWRTILLDSQFKIFGLRKDGGLASTTVRFNSVTDHLLAPFLKKIRSAGADSGIAIQGSELEKFDPWFTLNYKFMNYAKRSLLEGEKVVVAILQPEIWASRLTILGNRFSRRVSPTVAMILTDQELITIREEDKQVAQERYGGIWDYIPVKKISGLALSPKAGDLLVFSIQLSNGDPLEYLFAASAKREVDQLMERFRELTAIG